MAAIQPKQAPRPALVSDMSAEEYYEYLRRLIASQPPQSMEQSAP